MKKKVKKGLVVEGGGMRGSHTCGALMALIENGHWEFDAVAATSAGACTSAFLVSRQFDLLPRIWTEHLHGTKFIKFRNLTKKNLPIMDLDYLVDEIFSSLTPLDTKTIQESKTKFFMVATHCETGKPKYFEGHKDPILASLKASAALPFAYPQPVEINGSYYIDGGLSDPIPIQKVIDEGCEEVFVVLTRVKEYRKKIPFYDFLPGYYRKKFPHLAEAMRERHHRYNDTLVKLAENKYPAKITVIQPQGKPIASRMTRDLRKIKSSVAQGYNDAFRLLKGIS